MQFQIAPNWREAATMFWMDSGAMMPGAFYFPLAPPFARHLCWRTSDHKNPRNRSESILAGLQHERQPTLRNRLFSKSVRRLAVWMLTASKAVSIKIKHRRSSLDRPGTYDRLPEGTDIGAVARPAPGRLRSAETKPLRVFSQQRSPKLLFLPDGQYCTDPRSFHTYFLIS